MQKGAGPVGRRADTFPRRSAQSPVWRAVRKRGHHSISMPLKLLTVLALYHGTLLCGGFNVDERFPVVKEGFTNGSFFGFSVALHHQTEGTNKYL
uniref:Uncharacterized protein n=1 Tax=Knipowitschia caucasica TaxID=637954 RepID=A0AAV2L9T1_KNICA